MVVVILFVVGGLHWAGATDGSASAGTTLVRLNLPAGLDRNISLLLILSLAGHLLLLDFRVPDPRHVILPLLG